VEAFLPKLVLTPVLVGAASLAGRRWGAGVGGWLVGIPFTSGPIAFFLALSPGPHFAADSATGTIAGTVSQAAFALGYAWFATRAGWPASLAAATLSFAVVTVLLDVLAAGVAVAAVLAVASLLVAIALMPRRQRDVAPATVLPWWDIPARMIVATTFVIALTAAAPALGSRLTGLLSPFPLYATVLATFAHRLQGADAANAVLRGLLLGLFAFASFFLCVAVLVVPAGAGVAFAAAIVTAVAVQAVSLVAGRALKIAW
jgi:hypothetical protein